MKKTIILLMIGVILILTLVGCSGNYNSQYPTSTQQPINPSYIGQGCSVSGVTDNTEYNEKTDVRL